MSKTTASAPLWPVAAAFFIFSLCAVSMPLTGVTAAQASTNLLSNPSVETASSATLPQAWATDVWGTTKATFTYPTGGAQDGTRYVKTQITTKGTGDAKWVPSLTAATPGQTYAFSDWYQASVASTVEAEVLLTTGSYSYISLGSPAVSAGWTQFSKSFTAPANTKSITVIHYIQAVGTLSVDNYSLTSADGGTVVTKPVIASFAAAPASVVAGSSATLSWSVSPTSTLSISPNVGTVTGSSIAVSPVVTTTYTLTATNAGGTVTKTAKVTVTQPPKPTIASFSASPASIVSGSAAVLSWSSTNAATLNINNGVGTVTGTSVSVSPTVTTTYTLTATNPQGTVTKSAKITVTKPAKPAVASFTAAPASIVAGNSTTLSWSVTPTSTISISPNVGIVTGNSVSVSPTTTVTYTLTATNAAGTANKTAKVTVTQPQVQPKPAISAFSAAPSAIAAGDASVLSWTVANASSTSIQGMGVVAGNSTSVTPATTTAYVLVATNPQGSAYATTTITVSPLPPPPPAPKPTINSFSANPASVVEGSSATLSWDILNASSTSIDQGIGPVSGNAVTVSPAATTTYTITAINPQGGVSAQATITVTPLPPPPPPPPTNMIQNPTFAVSAVQGAGIVPAHWLTGAWGAASGAVFSYPVAGIDDDFAAQVSISSYPATGTGNGAAEWYFDTVPVTGGSFYSFSDSYKSDATSYVIAQWTLSGGASLYESVATLTPTGGAWKSGSFYFTAPANAVSLTILHQLQSTGTLAVDNYSLSAGVVPASEQLSVPVVSLAFDDGLLTQYDNALPILKSANMPASFYIISNLMAAVSTYDFFTDPGEAIGASTNAKGTTWNEIYTDPTEQHLHFSDTYTSASASTLIASYTLNGGTVNQTLATMPAGSNAKANVSFILPKKANGNTVSPITIAHTSSGGLTAGAPSLSEYGDGYMSAKQAQDVLAAGEEIGDHTRTHPDLTSLSPAGATDEIAGAKSALEAAGLGSITTIAYPLGDYNESIEAIAQSAGLAAARTTDIGYNGKSTDAFALKTGNIDTNTSFATVKAWIDTAIAQKLWLTLTIHNVDSLANLNAIGDAYGTTPEILQQIVSYLKSKQQDGSLQVKTMNDALPYIQ